MMYSPSQDALASEVVDELAMLLTSGRLNQERRQYITEVYQQAIDDDDATEGLIDIQQLMTFTPEFHTNGLSDEEGENREVPEAPPTSEEPYKAVVYLFLDGGYDSSNMLVPHACTGRNPQGQTVREQYDDLRGVLAFTEGQERSILIDAENQPCETFALHDEFLLLKDLYDAGDLTFFANMGLINQNGMTKYNFEELTRSQLFAHNAMQNEARIVDPYEQRPGTSIFVPVYVQFVDRTFSDSAFFL